MNDISISCPQRKNAKVPESPFARVEKPSKRKKPLYLFDKDGTEVLAARNWAGEVDCSRQGGTKSLGELHRQC